MARQTRKLGAVLFEGFELLDFYGPLEMFGCLGPELQIFTVAEKRGPVKSSPGPATVAEYSFADAPPFNLLLLPGGFGVGAQLENSALLNYLRRAHSAAEVFMSVCNGAALPARAGLLDGKRATTNKIFFAGVAAQGPQVQWVEEARWVRAGNIASASGVSAGMDMALAVIAELYGRERAEAIAVLTEYRWQPDAAADPFARYLNQTQWAAKAFGRT